MQVGPYPPQAPAPPVGYVSSTLVSDIETDLPDEDDDDEEDEAGPSSFQQPAAQPQAAYMPPMTQTGIHPGPQAHGMPSAGYAGVYTSILLSVA